VLNAKAIIGVVVLLCSFAIGTAAAAAQSYFPTTKQGALTKFETKASSVHVFTANSNPIECLKAVFKGTTPPTTGSKTLQVVPSYAECKLAGSTAKVVNTNCAFEFLTPSGTSPKFTGLVNIVAVPGQKLCAIVIIGFFSGIACEVKVENVVANKNLSLVKAVDLTGNLGSMIDSEISGITYIADTGTGCTNAGIVSGNTAKYTGEVETSAIFVA
jgi:hypothetical protein